MRCKECGYLNGTDTGNCIKCGTVLIPSGKIKTAINTSIEAFEEAMDQDKSPATVKLKNEENAFQGHPTVRGIQLNTEETVQMEQETGANDSSKEKKHTYFTCIECNYYPLKEPISAQNPCPNCGQVADAPVTATIQSGGTMKLSDIQIGETKISVSIKAEPGGQVVELEGKELLLNRTTLDPSNSSLSSGTHARISLENGSAFIEDLSSNGATFVQVSGKMELKNGTRLILGNKLYQVTIEEK
jgi:hypothetical protein